MKATSVVLEKMWLLSTVEVSKEPIGKFFQCNFSGN